MKKVLFILVVLAGWSAMQAQSFISQPDYPILKPSKEYRLKSSGELPTRVDNSQTKYFPPIISQHGWSCNQANSIGYTLTYELNQLRELDSKEWENQYAPLFPWNFLNSCSASVGVSYFDTWEVVKAAGCATYKDFPVYNQTATWMSGYEKYYSVMQNRIIQNFSIPVGTAEGIHLLKNYLFDHADGSPHGGIGNVQIASGGMHIVQTHSSGADAGAPILISFGEVVGHALSVVGYDDDVSVDINGDGEITNDIDINYDGVVDMGDWEKGALILTNSWGSGWGRNGQAYCSYSCLTREGHQGGIWNRSVHVVKAVKEYEPVLTMKVIMDHTSRNKFRILAGVATDPEATEPEFVIGFPHFNFQGDTGPLFSEEPQDTTRFELGLDISHFTTYLEPGQDARFFLLVDEKDPTDIGQGKIRSFSVLNYGIEVIESVSDEYDTPILNDQTTTVSLINSVQFNKVNVLPEEAAQVSPGEEFTKQLAVSGGEGPYLWELVEGYEEEHFERSYPEMGGDTLMTSRDIKHFTWVDLPFKFPFYGEEHVAVVVDKNGALHFNNEYYDYPYAINTDLVFKVRRSIIPLGRALEYEDEADMISYQANDSVVKFLWAATVNYRDEQYNVNFATYLYADGRIEFHYGPFSQPKGAMFPWIAGISFGDGRNFEFATVSDLGILFQNYGVCFQPHEYPGEVSITDDGLLRCRPSEYDQIWNVFVQVRDKNNQIDIGAVPISTVDWAETEILSQNYPNPFSGITAISFKVPSEQDVKLRIYDNSGRLVKDLVSQNLFAGEYIFYWNGTNELNRDLAGGTYFYRLELSDRMETRKIVLVR